MGGERYLGGLTPAGGRGRCCDVVTLPGNKDGEDELKDPHGTMGAQQWSHGVVQKWVLGAC